MKIFARLILGLLIISGLKGYSQCASGDLRTNEYICGKYVDNNGYMKWDWEIMPGAGTRFCETWQARTQQGNGLTVMGSPFVNAGTSALELISQQQDYTRAKGWELLRRNFGCDAEIGYPYFILYNKYTGLMRVYIYRPVNSQEYDEVMLQLEPSKAPYPATTSLGEGQVIAPDKYLNDNASGTLGKVVFSVSERSGRGQWTMAEFSMALDPNIANSNYAGAGIKITMFGVTNSTVVAKIKGRSVTGSEPLIYNYSFAPNEAVPATSPGQTVNFQTQGEKFIKFGKTITETRNGINKAADDIYKSLSSVNMFGSSLKSRIKKKAFNVWDDTKSDEGFGKLLGQIASFAGAAGNAIKMLGGVIGLFSSGDDKPGAMPTYTAYDLQLNGTITARNVSQTFIIRVPGTTPVGNSTSGATYYKCQMGIFNIQNTPQADVVTYERAVKHHYFSNSNTYVESREDFVSYRMRNNLAVTYNYGAGLELVSAQAAIVGEVQPDGNGNALYDLTADHVFDQPWAPRDAEYNLMLPDLQAGILEVVSYDVEKGLHTFQTPYVNVECLNGLAFNARAETNIFLRVKAILKKRNDPDNTPILYIKDYKIDTYAQEIDNSTRNSYRFRWSYNYLPPYYNYAEQPLLENADKIISNRTYTGYTEEKADNTITTENNVVVAAGQEALFKAGYEVNLEPGFSAETGSYFEAKLKIDQLNLSCGSLQSLPYEQTGGCYDTDATALRVATKPNEAVNAATAVDALTIYPVPTNGRLVITGLQNSGNTVITIIDQSGRTVREIKAIALDSGQANLDVSSLNNGVYFIKIQTPAQTAIKKIVVSK